LGGDPMKGTIMHQTEIDMLLNEARTHLEAVRVFEARDCLTRASTIAFKQGDMAQSATIAQALFEVLRAIRAAKLTEPSIDVEAIVDHMEARARARGYGED
jgi:5-carboxymethyl-2-hydroxymuconate isomerase